MLIRDGGADDLQSMYALDCVCFAMPFRFTRTAMRRYTTAAGAFSLIAEDERFLGFVVVQVETTQAGVEGYVVTLDVEPSARRQGTARTLMEAAEERARNLGCAWMTLHVWTENEAALRLYDAAGFERVMLDADFYGAGIHAAGYRKRL